VATLRSTTKGLLQTPSPPPLRKSKVKMVRATFPPPINLMRYELPQGVDLNDVEGNSSVSLGIDSLTFPVVEPSLTPKLAPQVVLTPRVMSQDISLLLDEAGMLTPRAVLLDET
jgi:hypothetical protein